MIPIKVLYSEYIQDEDDREYHVLIFDKITFIKNKPNSIQNIKGKLKDLKLPIFSILECVQKEIEELIEILNNNILNEDYTVSLVPRYFSFCVSRKYDFKKEISYLDWGKSFKVEIPKNEFKTCKEADSEMAKVLLAYLIYYDLVKVSNRLEIEDLEFDIQMINSKNRVSDYFSRSPRTISKNILKKAENIIMSLQNKSKKPIIEL